MANLLRSVLALGLYFALFYHIKAEPCPFIGSAYPPLRDLTTQSSWQNFASALHGSLTEFTRVGNSPFGELKSNDTSFSIHMIAADSGEQLFDFHHLAYQHAPNSSNQIDANTVYRVASISKLFTVYALLLEGGGVKVFDEPVTKYLPQLVQYANRGNDLDQVRWNEITLGALASHTAGVPREYYAFDLAVAAPNMNLTQLGLAAPAPSDIPTCITWGASQNCSEQDFLDVINARHPTFPVSYGPAYSNEGFNLLGMALERISNKSYGDTLNSSIIKKLNLTRTSVRKPADSLGAIPLVTNNWADDFGLNKPTGGVYSSAADLTRFGASILNHVLLNSSETRRWMKPHTFTNSLFGGIGAPWEIYRHQPTNSTNYSVDLYGKGGGIPGYNSWLVLIPDYNVVLTILTAGNNILDTLRKTLSSELLPALADAARERTAAKFAGTFTSMASGLNASVTFSVEDGPGLLLTSLRVGNVTLSTLLNALGSNPKDSVLRAYPTGLTAVSPCSALNSTNVRRCLGFRLVLESASPAPPKETFLPEFAACNSWGAVDSLVYANVGLDEVVIGVDGGERAVEINLRGMRTVL